MSTLTLDPTPPAPRADDRNVPRAIRERMPQAQKVLEDVAAEHGVCARPIALRRINEATGESEVVGLPCRATRASVCPACAEKARRLRMQQAEEGWHLTEEPIVRPDPPTDDQRALVTYRAALVEEYATASPAEQAEVAAAIAAADTELAAIGVRGKLTDPSNGDGGDGGDQDQDGKPAPKKRHRSTRRRQDVPDLPFVPVDKRTIGQVYEGRDGRTYRPSTFLTATLRSYGPVLDDGTPVDPRSYDYRGAARDAIHFAALVDRLWQNLRRVVGYNVQYFATVEPQKRLAPHLHSAIRGTFARKLMRQVLAATYLQVWWPAYDPDRPVYTDSKRPEWNAGSNCYVDPDTGDPLPTFDEALDAMPEDADPVHVARFGPVADIQGVTEGSQSARSAIRYLTKYLTKDIGEICEPNTDRERAHRDRLAAALRVEPCSDRCANWLRYGIQPRHARPGLIPGRCKGKAHRRDTLGFPGRREWVSRHWTGKTLTDHRRDRRDYVMRVLGVVGKATDAHQRHTWQLVKPADPDAPSRDHLVMRALAQHRQWQTAYQAARAAAPPGPLDVSATDPAAEAA